jgi:hypothetical protein
MVRPDLGRSRLKKGGGAEKIYRASSPKAGSPAGLLDVSTWLVAGVLEGCFLCVAGL